MLTYYSGIQVVVYVNADRGSNSIQRQSQGVGPGKGKREGKEVVLMKCLLDCVADPLPNMIMSWDRGLVTALLPPANLVHFVSLGATHYCNGPPYSTSTCYTSLSHPSTASLLDDRICPPAQYTTRTPMTYLYPRETCSQRGQMGPLTPPLWVPRSPPTVTCLGCMRMRMSSLPCSRLLMSPSNGLHEHSTRRPASLQVLWSLGPHGCQTHPSALCLA